METQSGKMAKNKISEADLVAVDPFLDKISGEETEGAIAL
jgi:hypothetical protein